MHQDRGELDSTLRHLTIDPGVSRATCDRQTWKRIVETTSGEITHAGKLYRIENVALGAGMYRLQLEEIA